MKGSIRKRCLKRALALVSSLAMMGSFSYATGASEILSYNVISATATEDGESGDEVEGGDTTPPGTPETKEFSRIDVEITNQFDFKEDFECTVKVCAKDTENNLIEGPVEIGKEKKSKIKLSTPYIASGTYNVEVSVPGFQTFSQEVSVDDTIFKLPVSIGFDDEYRYIITHEKGNDGEDLTDSNGEPIEIVPKHPGGMRVGDVNGDSFIDPVDLELLIGAISKSENNNNTLHTDLNYDGVTNLRDLEFFTIGIIDTQNYRTDANNTQEVKSDKKYQDNVNPETSTKTEDGKTLLDFLITDDKNADENKDPFTVPLNESGTTDIDTEFKEPEMLKDVTFNNTNVEAGAILITDDEGNTIEYDFGGYISNAGGENEGQVITHSEDDDNLDDVNYITVEDFMAVANNTPIPDINSFPDNPGEDDEDGSDGSDGSERTESESKPSVVVDENGTISLNLGAQIAVKKITLKISSVNKNTTLAEIGTVKFLNGMEKLMADPEPDFPTEVTVVQGNNGDSDADIIINWKEPKNSSGRYEVEVSTSPQTNPDGSFRTVIPGLQNEVTKTNGGTISFRSQHGNFKLIKLNTTYYVHVRSIGAEDTDTYSSKWSDYAEVTTVSKSKPDKPDALRLKCGFQSISASWSADKTNSAKGYTLYYRNMTKGETEFKSKEAGLTTSCTLMELDDVNEYEVYVVAYNDHGSSEKSVSQRGTTTSIEPVILPKYGAINCSDDGQLGDAHIVNVTIEKNENTKMFNCEDAWGVVDGNQETYYKQGGMNDEGIIYEFDDEYTINYMYMVPVTENQNFWKSTITAWDAAGNKQTYSQYAGEEKLKDANGKTYFRMTIPPVKAKKIKVQFNRYPDNENFVAYSEIAFYNDSLMEEIMALYADDLHTVLEEHVTIDTINELREKVKSPDIRNGESNPKQKIHEAELNTAEKLLNAEKISPPVEIHNGITTNENTNGKSRNYSGLNAWQPLGVTAGGNTQVTIYVGGKNKTYNQDKISGEGTQLRLIITQYNSESGSLVTSGANLKIGANTITVPDSKISGAEAGGAFYVQYQGNANDDEYCYSVRVEGGTPVPVLDLYKVTDETERLERAAEYIRELDTYVAGMEDLHNQVHLGATYGQKNQKNTAIDMEYNKELCILGATDILGDNMMYSLPAPQILAGLGSGSVKARAVKLIDSMNAIENMVTFFYQHKGMSADAKDVVDKIPNQHLNIRYQRMFQGAFMYAAGNHIGIQWGSAPGMVSSSGVKSDEAGRYVSGSYFGWGIAHEIGHDLNDSNYTVAEITNNYFAMLAQSQDKNEGSRLNYNNIFKKVTSGTKGSADQGTQLGMYWQLHLAFDKDFNYKTYNTNSEILDNLFYARMDTYSRNPSKAPSPKGVPLVLSGGTDQKLMRLACAAAEKNILEFFIRWGKTPDHETLTYAANFEPETRAIMYANEDSRVYAMNGKSSLEDDPKVLNNVTLKVGKGTQANKVDISIDVSDKIKPSDILGYEIIRCTISGGDVKETPIAFTKTPNYTDVITSFNNRTVSYKVTLIDQYLHRSEVAITDMIKIEHDGTLDKTNWSVATKEIIEAGEIEETEETKNNTNKATTAETDVFKSVTEKKEATADTFDCHPTVIDPITKAFDSDFNTAYEAEVKGAPSIYINLRQSVTISGLKYTTDNIPEKAIGYAISVKIPDNEEDPKSPITWHTIEEGSFEFDKNGTAAVYFTNEQKKYLSTYDTAEVKLQILGMDGEIISISEIDILGVTGDNVDFRRDGKKGDTAFGVLSEDYRFSPDEEDYIPAGSYVFIGSYKGNAAYNAVILYDENGRIVGTPAPVEEKKTEDTPADIDPELAEAFDAISKTSEEEAKEKDGTSTQIILADIPDGQKIADVKDGTFVYWVTPEDAENMIWPEKVRVELYRVNDAINMTGQRIVSDSLFEEVPVKDQMAPISISGDRKYTTE